jgi:hypothetical protein
MPANSNEIKFRNAVKRAGVNLANKTANGYYSFYTYQDEGTFLDENLNVIHYYDVRYKNAQPVWFTFHSIDLFRSQQLHAAGFEFKFVEIPAERGTKKRVGFYKAPTN